MAVKKLNIVRDAWWVNSSGTNYLTDENGQFSSQSHGLYKSLNSNDAQYIQFHGSGTNSASYFGRLESTNLVPGQVWIDVRASGIPTGSWATVGINALEIGSFGSWSGLSTQSGVFDLTTAQKSRILGGRISDNYDYFSIQLTNSGILSNVKLYDMEVYYSGDHTWTNYEIGLPNVLTEYFYPNNLNFRNNSVWIDTVGNVVGSSGYYNINVSPSSIGVDNTYIQQINTPSLAKSWRRSSSMTQGGLSLGFNFDTIDPLTQITRAQLTLRASLPPSGLYENSRDTFEINGYSSRFKEQDYKDEMSEEIGSIQSKNTTLGYFLYGAGSTIEQSGFMNYVVDLNFLDPNLPNGDIASTVYRNIDVLSNMEFKIIGMPSGVQLSAAELLVEYLPNDTVPLYITGNVFRSPQSSYVNIGGIDNPLYGDGGWHHRGNLNEGTIFDAFYNFAEPSGWTTWPISLNVASGAYGEYVNSLPEYNEQPEFLEEDVETEPTLVEPQRKNYYRNPIITGFSSRTYDPTYYRDMIYNGSPFLPWDVHNPDASLYSPNITQVYFKDRIVLDTDFTLYFMLYREPTNNGQSYGRIFQRGVYGIAGEIDYEIIGSLETERLKFSIKDTNDNAHSINVVLPYYTLEPILIWFTCIYSEITNETTCRLAVHTDIKHYFTKDWEYAEITFSSSRKVYTDAETIIGALWTPQTANDQLTYNSFLSYLSIVEFGWADSYIALDYQTSSSTIINNYDISTDIDKQFFASRICNSNYLLGRAYEEGTIAGEPTDPGLSGWMPPGDVLSLGGQSTWIMTDAAKVKYGGVATVQLPPDTSDWLFGYNFGFNIPSGEIITGCEVKYRAACSTANFVRTHFVYLGRLSDSSGNILTYGADQTNTGPIYWNSTAFWPDMVYGGSTNTWGMGSGLTNDIVNDSHFGVGIQARSSFGISTYAYVDYIELKVYTSGELTGEIGDYKSLHWYVPTGSGSAQWGTRYTIDEWMSRNDNHSLFNPVTTAGTNNLVHPSAIYIEIETEHNTDHPSGVYLTCDVEFDTGSTDNWKVLRSEFNVPSGGLTTQIHGFSKHIGMNQGPIEYSSIDNIAIKMTTQYVDMASQEYYGDLHVKSIKVYFDSYCVATTGVPGDIDLYTHGSAPTLNNDVDLFAQGMISNNNDLDLYIYGLPHYASGDLVTLYASGSHYVMPPYGDPNVTKMPLYINGLTPISVSNNFPLYMWATPAGVGGIYKSTKLFISGIGRDGQLPLFLQGRPFADSTASLNLYLENDATIDNGIDLFILGPSGINNITYLYIRGLGTLDGGYPNYGNIPLFMARDSESVDGRVALYMAQHTTIEDLDGYIQGHIVANSSVPLYIYGSGIIINSTKLYTHGF